MIGKLHFSSLMLYDGLMKYHTAKNRDAGVLSLNFCMNYSGTFNQEKIRQVLYAQKDRFIIHHTYKMNSPYYISIKSCKKRTLYFLATYPYPE